MKKNLLKFALVATIGSLMVVGLTGCGSDADVRNTAIADPSVAGSEKEAEAATGDKEGSVEKADTAETEKEAADSVQKVDIPYGWADLENRAFAVDGHIFILGKSTLQDMRDAGIEFDERDLSKLDEILTPYATTRSIKVVFTDGRSDWKLTVQSSNDSTDSIKAADCVITKVECWIDHETEQNRVKFAAPFDLTEESLIAECGEPTHDIIRNKNYVAVMYKVNYMNAVSGYTFTFDTDGTLDTIEIDWNPDTAIANQ